MNLNAIKAYKAINDYIKELPEDFRQKMWELFDDMKRVSLTPHDYIETFEESIKSNMKHNLADAAMWQKIREPVKEDDIFKLLFSEYIISTIGIEEEKKLRLIAHYKYSKEIYDKNADLIDAYRIEMGITNPYNKEI